MDLSELEDLFGDRLVTSEAVRSQHSHDESWHVPENLPDAVVFPETSNEVSRIISFASKNNIPVIFYFNGIHEDYHKVTDTVEKIDFQKIETITRLVFLTAWELANREERIVVDKIEN